MGFRPCGEGVTNADRSRARSLNFYRSESSPTSNFVYVGIESSGEYVICPGSSRSSLHVTVIHMLTHL